MEEVIAVKKLRSGALRYRVQWTGYNKDPVWYPASNFKYAPHKLQDFHLQHPERNRPLRRIREWIKA